MLVPVGVTLIIEPGVKLSLETHFLQVNGTLMARGTENNRIIITGSGHIQYDRGRIIFYRN